ncbi:fimbrial protein [Bordetella sp. BOR01]|uniref:fimbrial protein n=1 Tax=Bordetella sp. BOR01 TaxID=2854779 RepID=UPI001C4899D4|nr:fimbrial protein [Bordetella sp. BOR01]MBV7484291.1 type 1 fimbrial protein [Bordetella sp. BOR01]
MTFPKHIIPVTAIAAMAVSSAAFAIDGTINFEGLISDVTCEISVNGATNNATVTMPSASIAALATAGSTAGVTPFNINLTGCAGPTLNTAHTHFEMGPSVDAITGHLNNVTGTAGNVQVQLLNALSAPIAVGRLNQGDTAVDISSGAGTMSYFARYYATGPATAGTVGTRVDYTIQYE